MLMLLAAARPESRGEALAAEVLRAVVPVLPVTVVCAVLLFVGLVPEPLEPLYRFSALAPPLAGAIIAVVSVLAPVGGTESMSVSVVRYLRGFVRFGAIMACGIGLCLALMPLFDYSEDVVRQVRAAFVLWLLVGWLGLLLRRDELLAMIGARGPLAEVGVLRAGVRRLYRLFALGPVLAWLLYAFGYVNLARLLVRGGLVTLSVLLLAPWVHHRISASVEKVLGYPDGGGWLALSPEGSRAAYRSVAPVILLAVGGASIGLLASGWNYSGNVFGNLASAVTHPLFVVGGSRITGLSIVLLGVTIALTFLVARWTVQLLGRIVYPLYDLDRGTRATIDTLVRYLVFGLGAIVALDVVGVGIGFLTVFAGVIGVAVGFGSQTLAANFIAGLILLVARRISVDDVVELDGFTGRVIRIGGYATTIKTLENLLVIVPNGKLIDGSVVNWTVEDTSVRIELTVGVAYGSDVALTRQLLLDAALADPRVLRSPTPLVRFDDFGDSALTFTLNPWIVDPDTRFIVASDLRFRIDRLFHDNGVEIAFPQQDVHLRTGDGTIRVALENGYTVRDEAGNVLVDPTPGDHRTAG